MRKVVILGSTGSIGRQALEVVSAGAGISVVALAAKSSAGELAEQAGKFGVKRVCLSDEGAAARLAEEWDGGEVLSGHAGLVELIVKSDAELVLNAIVGAAGLEPTVAALGEGKDLALANKESLVVGGELVMQLAEAKGAQIVPVDSEHSALFQLIRGERFGPEAGTIERLVLTASGGPFRGETRERLREVRPDETLAHPTWNMGGKITVDSATLMNKGLELIEAHHLFGVPYKEIDVVVHPQSIVHGMIQLVDGSSIAHLGYPDMRVPISYALHFPRRDEVSVRQLDLAKAGSLTFERPDEDTFGCLALARRAAEEGGTAPCVLNAANEVAVRSFLEGRLTFLGIEDVIGKTLAGCATQPASSFDVLLTADGNARKLAEECVDEAGASMDGVGP